MIDIRGISDEHPLQGHVRRTLSAALARLRPAPLGVQVRFVDDNGPKGGVDTRCALTVRVPFRPLIRVEHMGQSARHAFDQALAVLGRQLERDEARARDARRRPKKYYAAARLLADQGAAAGKPARRAR
jgi:ribosome-associated translation inhibitor RaiA